MEMFSIFRGVLRKCDGSFYRLTYSINSSLKLYNFMYNGIVSSYNDLFLERKKIVFEKYIKMRSQLSWQSAPLSRERSPVRVRPVAQNKIAERRLYFVRPRRQLLVFVPGSKDFSLKIYQQVNFWKNIWLCSSRIRTAAQNKLPKDSFLIVDILILHS